MTIRNAIFSIAACAITLCASAQNSVKPAAAPATAPTDCPAAEALKVADLYGRWHVQIDGEAGGANVQLQKDPDQDDSLVGSITRPAAKGQRDKPALLAGEVQNGDFNLEESDDGVRISATWTGQVVEASCGKEIKGTWTNTTNDMGNDSAHAFVLRKQAGWQ